MNDGGYLFPQDKPVANGNKREGGATMRDFFAFAALCSGYSPKESFEIADEALAHRK